MDRHEFVCTFNKKLKCLQCLILIINVDMLMIIKVVFVNRFQWFKNCTFTTRILLFTIVKI